MAGMHRQQWLRVSGIMLAVTMAVPAVAQEKAGNPADAPAPSAQAAGGLEDIVVTARRRTESVQNVPASIQAYTAVQLDRRDLSTIEKIATTTPQLSIGRAANGSGAQLFMRGIGTTATSVDQAQSVAVIVDNVYYEHGRIIDEGFFDLARVEVLKGPQALFFGKNATAGAISITTADPGAEREIKARVGYEVAARQIYGEIIGSGPLSDTLGLRVALRGSRAFGGLFKNGATDALYHFTDLATGNVVSGVGAAGPRDLPQDREFMGRVTLKWQPNSDFTANLKASGTISDNNDPGANYVPYRCPTGFSSLNPSTPCSTSAFTVYHNQMPQVIVDSGFPYAGDGNLYNRYRSYSVSGTFEYKLGHVTVTSVNNYNWNRNTYNYKGEFQSGPAANIWATENTTFHSFSSELRARTDFDGPINLLLGGYFQDTARAFGQYVANAGLFDSSVPAPYSYVAFDKISSGRGRTLSAYGQALWKIVPDLELTAGARYTHETKKSRFIQEHVFDAFTSVFVRYDPNDPTTQIIGNQTFDNWSPDMTLTWRPSRDVTVYGAFKTAYKSGGFSGSAIYSALSADPLGDFEFDPERAKGFEVGIKTTLLDHQLRVNLGAYTYKYSNVQIEYFDPLVFALRNYNAGSIRTKGVELSAEYAPRAVAGLSLHGEIDYNHAQYGDFPAPCYTGETPAQGCTLKGPSGDPFQNLVGKTPAMAPRWTGLAGITFDSPVGKGLSAGATVDARYSGSYLASGFDSPYSRVGAYLMLDASLRLRSDSSGWELAVIGKNLTNRLIINGLLEGPATGSGTGTAGGIYADQFGFASSPRTVQIQATMHF